VLDPEDVAEAVAFFLSAASHRITGQTLVVDAGFTLPG
jgi:NAD(P)-dependent dehydrogenase (short-subunit alcohol dehydrogenase family)